MMAGTPQVTFHATVLLNGRTATGIQVPDDVVERLGAGRRPAVRATLGTFTYRTTVAPMGGRFLMPVSAGVRERAGVAAGDEVDVVLEVDTGPRELAVPLGLRSALDADPTVAAAFERLSYSRRQRLVLPVEGARTPETRQRRIDAALAALRDGRA